MGEMSESHYDAQADVLYITSGAGPVLRSVEAAPGVTLEYGEQGRLLGIEILRALRIIARDVVAGLSAKQAGAAWTCNDLMPMEKLLSSGTATGR